MELWESFKMWFISLGENYGVNPYIFGSIYIGAIPLFFLCLRWTVSNIRQKKPILLPVMLTGLCFISAYLYLIVAGKNIPVWVYIFIACMIIYGVISTVKKIKSKSEA